LEHLIVVVRQQYILFCRFPLDPAYPDIRARQSSRR
jgi:hypothetical protein